MNASPFRWCRTITALALLLLAVAAARGEEKRLWTPQQAAAVDDAVKAEMERQQLVGAAVGIVRNGEIVYTKGFGLADRERDIAVTVDTVFNWASNSKPLGAVLALQLVEQKKLDLDRDVRDYVPRFPDKGKPITARQLLCHQSGIPHYANGIVIPFKQTYAAPLPFTDPTVALDHFLNSLLLFAPGEKVSYSSYAYVLLSAVVQEAGEEPFLQQVQKRIADPLRMKSLQLDVPAADQPHWTTGYQRKKGEIEPVPEYAHYWKHAAGGFKSNIQDFAVWSRALVDHTLLTPEASQPLWKPAQTSDGRETDRSLGFVLNRSPQGLMASHGGSQDETRTHMVLFPETKDTVVLLCNTHHADMEKFYRAIAKVLEPLED